MKSGLVFVRTMGKILASKKEMGKSPFGSTNIMILFISFNVFCFDQHTLIAHTSGVHCDISSSATPWATQ
jgi:hypothetical protein